MALSQFPRLGIDPFVELRRMQSEMNRLFTGFSAATAREFPPINIWLGDNSVVITAELPGVTRDDINLSLQEDVLTLEGSRPLKTQQQEVKWHRRERAYGTFARTVQLPFRVDADKVQARFDNGILEIELERLEADRPKKSRSAPPELKGGNCKWPRKSGPSIPVPPPPRKVRSRPPAGPSSRRLPTSTRPATA